MTITAEQVKELRALTGAGMMDCKVALKETAGNMDAAVDWLRKKGIAKADKKADRAAAEGLVGVAGQDNKAIMVEVNSETDFVARNEEFQALVRNIMKTALETASAGDSLFSAKYGDNGKTVDEAMKEAVAAIGENLCLRRSVLLEVEEGVVATYIHNSISGGLGKLGVLVALETTGDKQAAVALGRQIAMHIAAINPLALNQSELDPAIVNREVAIFSDQAKASGKPDNIIEKMVEGRIRKFYEEVVLLSQSFVMNTDITVSQALKEAEKNIGAPVTIKAFVRFALGEGVAKPEADFAEEVAGLAKR